MWTAGLEPSSTAARSGAPASAGTTACRQGHPDKVWLYSHEPYIALRKQLLKKQLSGGSRSFFDVFCLGIVPRKQPMIAFEASTS
jgi:hypothetical protein